MAGSLLAPERVGEGIHADPAVNRGGVIACCALCCGTSIGSRMNFRHRLRLDLHVILRGMVVAFAASGIKDVARATEAIMFKKRAI